MYNQVRGNPAEGAALHALGRLAEAEEIFEGVVAARDAARESLAVAPSTNVDIFAGGRVTPYHELIELRVLAGRTADDDAGSLHEMARRPGTD